MILKTNEFQNVCKTISTAVDNNAANLEVKTKDTFLYLSVTNNEYYVSVKFELETPEEFRAVVSASLFLNLIASLTAETFELKIKDNTVIIKSGKSSYKLAMINENSTVMELPIIKIENPTVTMPINLDILKSILNVNSKELLKIKNSRNVDLHELQKLYYITNEGCFTFTTGACLNSFTLEKPVKFLLNDRIVKLFKLFNTDVSFTLGHDPLSNGTMQTKISLETGNIYLAAVIINDDRLLTKVNGPCTATKNYIDADYKNKLVLSVSSLNAAISRLLLFTKNSVETTNKFSIPMTVSISNNELTICDAQGNSEIITIENGSYVDNTYEMKINIVDIKLVLDSCDCDYITLNCGNNNIVVLTRGTIYNLIKEYSDNN